MFGFSAEILYMVQTATSERAYPQGPFLDPAQDAHVGDETEQRALEIPGALPAGKQRRAKAARPEPFQPGLAPHEPAATPAPPAVVRHTTVPRLLVAFAPLMGLMGCAAVVLLKQRGLLTETTELDTNFAAASGYQLDPSMNTMAIEIAFLVVAMPIFAWGWWVVAATLNARAKSRKSGRPWTVPVAVLVAVAALLGSNFVPAERRPIMFIVFAVAYVGGAYVALLGLRKSARAIKADDLNWSRLIWIPWVAGLVSVVVFKVAGELGRPDIVVYGLLVPLGLVMWGWLTLCDEMASFDRSCRTVEIARGDAGGLPVFMTGTRAVR